MEALDIKLRKPTKYEQQMAKQSCTSLFSAMEQIKNDYAEIEIEETGAKIVVPIKALKMLGEILKAMSKGNPITIVPQATEVTTQMASEILGCSRPYIVKLLEEGKIDYTKIGKHRRIKYEDIVNYKRRTKEEQKALLIDIMNSDEESGLYDS